jgi:hypothetical protein
MRYIREIDGSYVALDNGISLKIGRSRIPVLKKAYYEFSKKNAH